jgi:hypothetical protein
MTQRRFSSLDNDDLAIKWPELQQDGLVSGNLSSLKPLDTHRTGGAGIGDDGEGSQWGGDMGGGSVYGGGGDHHRNPSQGTLLGYGAMEHARTASYEHLAMVDGAGAYGQQQQHYDPFSGQGYPSGAGVGGNMVYPPPSFYPPSHHNSPSMDSNGNAPFDSNQQRQSYPSSFTSSGEGGGAVPRGAPGAGGAYRVASPPVGSRAESPFVIPAMGFEGGEPEKHDEKHDDEKEEKRDGPL